MDRTTTSFLAVATIGLVFGCYGYFKSRYLGKSNRFRQSMQRKNWQWLQWIGWGLAVLDLIVFGFVRSLGLM